jgi:hypothetical protein
LVDVAARAFTDLNERLRRSLDNALEGCLVRAIREEPGGRLVVEASRPEGEHVSARFLGVKRWRASMQPQPGSVIHVGRIGGLSLLDLLGFMNILARQVTSGTRVRIAVGAATLDIECQDVEWWQEEEPEASQA